MWIIILTILFLLMQNCLTTKIDLPDSEEYEDGINSFFKDNESSTPDYPLKSSKEIVATADSKEIEKSSPGYQDSQHLAEKTVHSIKIERSIPNNLLGQSLGEKTGDSKEIERSSPIEKTHDPKEKQSSSNNLLLSQSYTKQTRRVSVIEPQITLSRERKSIKSKKEKKLHRHRHRSAIRSPRQPSIQGSKEIEQHSLYYPNYAKSQSSRKRTSHNDDRKIIRRSNDPDKYDSEKDENIKKKLTSLVEQTLHDTEKKIESVQVIKNANRDLAPYKIGFILSMVKKSRDMLNELFNTAVKHRDSWRALEQLKIFELIAHTNVDTTNLVRQLVEIHIQYVNSTIAHDVPKHPPPQDERKRLVML